MRSPKPQMNLRLRLAATRARRRAAKMDAPHRGRWPLGRLLLVLDILPVLAIAASPQGLHDTGPAGPVDLSRPWAVAADKGADTIIGFTLHNAGTGADALIGTRCATAQAATLVGPDAGGQPGQALKRLDLAAGQSVALSPAGLHVVLHDLYQPAMVGQTLHCTATFARSGERLVEAQVLQAAPAAR